MKKVGLASDHAGFELKEFVKTWLTEKGYPCKDFGTYSTESCDYADYAHPLALAIEAGECGPGVAICGSGEGISMTLNKHQGIRAALCWMPEIAHLSRQHNDANVLVMPGRFIDHEMAEKILDEFFNSGFEGGRHQIHAIIIKVKKERHYSFSFFLFLSLLRLKYKIRYITMKKILFLMLLCLPFIAMAQTDPKYLAGAITMNDGKVSFKTEIQAPSLTKDQLYGTMLKWATERFKPEGKFNARVLYTNEDEGTIAAGGEEYLVFSSSALSLDRTRIYYQLFITCENGKCDIEMTRIRYWYDEARDGGEKYSAEEWIVDDMALNKSKTKLAPICGKFRRETIDLKDTLFKSIQDTLGNKVLNNSQIAVAPAPGVTATPISNATTIVTATPVTPPAQPAVIGGSEGNTEIKAANNATPSKEQSIDDQIKASSRMTITAGNDEQFEIGKECWGGFGQLFGKEVAFCVIDQAKSMGNMLMDQSDNYKISFYKQGNSEPWLIVNCKKLMKQTVTGEEAKKMNPSNDGQKAYNMYVGEVIK